MRYLFFIVCISFLLSCANDPPPPAVSTLNAEIGLSEAQLDSIISLMDIFPDQTQFAITLIDDSSEYHYGYTRQRDSLFSVDNADSVFEIGSMSKVFTAHLLSQKVTEGMLSLNDPVSNHIDLDLHTDSTITLLQLANHTSGLPRIPPDMLWSSIFHRDNPYKDYEEDRLTSYMTNKMKVENQPGTIYHYSNLGYGILGYILEQHSGQSYESMLRKQLFDSLQMHRTGTKRDELHEYLVQGLDREGERTSNWDLAALKGAGAILSTSDDLANYARKILHQPDTAIRLQLEETYRLDPRRGIGLGWHILNVPTGPRDTTSRQNQKRLHWHNGGTGGYRSCMVFNTGQDCAVILLTNMSAGHPRARRIDRLAFDLLEQMDD